MKMSMQHAFVHSGSPLNITTASPRLVQRRPRRLYNATRMSLPGPRISNISESATDAAQKSRALEAWLEENGMYLAPQATWGRAKHPLAIANETTDDGEASGRGLVAVKGIVQGEPVFEVPLDVLLTKEAALRNIPAIPDTVDEYIAIAILLIRERSLGEESFWKPYIDILPDGEELIPLFRWSEEDLQLLEGSPCLAATASLRDKLESEYVATEEDIFERDRAAFPEEVFTREAWSWAFAILFSRAIMLTAEQRIALVPYADLLNHNPFCSTYIDVQSAPLSGERTVVLYTDRPYSQMDQVFVTYGPKSNAELLLLYGFVVDRNPYDSVELVVSPGEGDELYDRKKEYVESSGVQLSTAFPLYRDRYPMELIEYLRFCVANEEELENGDFGNFIGERNETLVAETLMQACRDALDSYPQTREEDDAIIQDGGIFQLFSQKQRWAIRQRRAEKRILERTIVNIEKEMSEPIFMFSESGE